MFFLAFALRHSNKQSQLARWRELLERGHRDYAALTGAEKRSFGQYPGQGIHVYGNFTNHNATVPRKLAGRDLAVRNSLIDMPDTPGARAWRHEYTTNGKLISQTTESIDTLLRETLPR